MKNIQETTEEVKVDKVVSYTCDKCGVTVTEKDEPFEYQEFIHINKLGGYGAKYGDMCVFEIDLCQDCWLALFREYGRNYKHPVFYIEDLVQKVKETIS